MDDLTSLPGTQTFRAGVIEQHITDMLDPIARTGLKRAMVNILRLQPGALLTAGLPCSSFIFLNRGTSKRSRSRPLGDQSKEYIKVSNLFLV